MNGVFIAVITPFKSVDGMIDFNSIQKYVNWIYDTCPSISGLVPCGTTGEFLSLTQSEQYDVIKAYTEYSNNRFKIIAGCSGITVSDTITKINTASEIGVSAVLAVCPYYIKPSQANLIEYFTTIHNNTDIPIVMYNNPGRTASFLSVDSVIELSNLKRVIGIKESVSDLNRIISIRKSVNKDFSILCGEDNLFLPFLSCGADGIISVTAGIKPIEFVKLFDEYYHNNNPKISLESAMNLHNICESMFCEANPAPIKYALNSIGMCENYSRLCLTLSNESKLKIKSNI